MLKQTSHWYTSQCIPFIEISLGCYWNHSPTTASTSPSHPNRKSVNVLRELNAWKSHSEGSRLYEGQSGTFQCTKHSVSWTVLTWVLSYNMTTSFVSMLGCFLLMAVWRTLVFHSSAVCLWWWWWWWSQCPWAPALVILFGQSLYLECWYLTYHSVPISSSMPILFLSSYSHTE
jgi:hypothetical protein